MKRMVDDLPAVRASTLVALGDIRRDAKTALLRFDDDGVEYQVGVRMMRFPGGGFGLGSCARDVTGAPNGFVCSTVSRRAPSVSGRAG